MSAYRTIDYQTCRFCHEMSYRPSTDMLRYGRRHWAHKACYLDRRGIDGLRSDQLGELPYLKLRDMGLLERVEAILGSGIEG